MPHFDQNIESLKQLLDQSRLPLVTGLENLTTEAQQTAVRFADRFACCIDTGFSDTGRDAMLSFQRYGNVTASLGEINHRSDVVVFWFCDPVETQPRFLERFIRSDSGQQKRVIVFDSTKTKTAELAEDFVHVTPEDALALVQGLRLSLQQQQADGDSDPATESWIDVLTAARYGSVFVGCPDVVQTGFDATTDQWFQLVKELNDHTRFVMGGIRNDRNGQGAENVLASISGFPSAVRYANGLPTHNGTEFSTASLLANRECDLLIVCDVADVPFESRLDEATRAWLETIPVVVLSNDSPHAYQTANLHFLVTTPGWNEPGDFMRADDVPIPLRTIAKTGSSTKSSAESSAESETELLRSVDVFAALLSN